MQQLRIFQSVRQRLPSLIKRRPNNGEHQLLILRLHRHHLMTRQPDHRTSNLRPRHKTVRRHIRHNIRLRIILHRQRQRPVILRSRPRLHPVRNLLLNHNRNRIHRHMILKQSHNNRRRNIIRKIRHNLDRPSIVLLLRQRRQVHLQNIIVDNLNIIIIRQRILQNRDQILVNFHRTHTPRSIRKILRQRTDTRSDFHNKIVRSDTCSGYNLIQHMWIDQKILTILFLKYKAVLLQYGYCILRLPEPRFYFLHKFSMYLELKVFLVKNHAVVRIGMLSGHASSEFTGSLFCMGDGTIHHIFDL